MKSKRQSRKPEAKQTAKRLYLGGMFNQKEIAQQVGTTDKTLGKWVREWKKEQAPVMDMVNNCIKRINAKLSDPKADPKEIQILVDTLGKLEKRLN